MGKPEKRLIQLPRIDIRARLLCWFMLLSIVPAVVIGYFAYRRSIEALQREASAGLVAVAKTRADHINDYFDEKKRDLALQSWDPKVVKALEQLTEITGRAGLQSEEHHQRAKAMRPFFRKYLDAHGLYDFLLISPRGDVVFTLANEGDFGASLRTGKHENTQLGRAFRDAVALLSTGVSDFRYYQPSGQPAAFLVAPVLSRGKLQGAVALQIDTTWLQRLVSNHAGLGATGEIVLTSRIGGAAVVMTPLRHDPQAAFRRKVAFGSSRAKPMQQALGGSKGHGLYVDYRGIKVLAAWRYLPHLRMGMVVKKDASEAFASANRVARWSVVGGILTLLCALIVVLVLANKISRPIRELTETTQAMAAGDLTSMAAVSTRDEIGDLAQSFNSMIKTFRDVEAVAEAVSRGDLEQKVLLKSERDTLGLSINRMTETLAELTEQNEQDRWLKTGQAELSGQMQGQLELPQLCQSIVTHLVQYLGAQAAALFVADSEGALRLQGSHVHGGEAHLTRVFQPGEGLVGQAAKTGEPIVLSEVPEGYFKVRSGLGGAAPRTVALFPMVHDGQVQGVLELGSFSRLTEEDCDLLQKVSQSIAVALHTAKSRDLMRELLAETQSKSEELQQQSEQLQAANEELAEQTEELRRSEEELHSQQAELQATNEELEEKSEFLGQQKAEIEQKNKALNRTTEELEAKAEELELASRYKSEFLANMSHELRTPLNSLLILARVLADNDEGNLTTRQVQAATVIHTSGRDLLNLINDILDLSKVEAGMLDLRVEPVRLDDVARSIRQQFEPLAGQKGVSLKVALAEGIPARIITDGQRLEQILRNLLANALKFTDEGAVGLDVCLPGPGVELQDPVLNPETCLAFAVSDTGPGVPDDKQRAIFEAFRQADGSTGRSHGGTGLGLAISRELAHLLGGEIQLQSREGEGSVFTLYMPLQRRITTRQQRRTLTPLNPNEAVPAFELEVTQKDPPPVYVPDDRDQIKDGDRTLLIIEDDVVQARQLMGLARDRGYKCLSAGSGASGLRMAWDFSPTAIVLDIGLPDTDGLTVLASLKEDPATRDIPVQMLSALDPSPEPLEMGAIGYLTKPASLDQIDEVFTGLERVCRKAVKEVLLLEDEPAVRRVVTRMMKFRGVEVTGTGSGQEGIELLRARRFDCLILDLHLDDMLGFEVLRQIDEDANMEMPPVVVYTGRELSHEEHQELHRYTSSIVIKGGDSAARLLDETTMFLHSVESELPADEQAPVRLLHDPEQVLQGRKVLLVDDDMRNTFALSSVLQTHGLKVLMADNGGVCLDKLAEEPDVDLIIMDIMMPVMDGYETMRRIRQQERFVGLPIIALTAKAMPDDRARCLQAGASDYLTKPVEMDKLLSMMRVWLYKKA